MPKTKIIATIGPASNNATTLRKMMLAGLDVARFNFSHGTQDDLLAGVRLVRVLNKKYRRRIKILGDLEGNRIRIGKLNNHFELKKNRIVYITQKTITGGPDLISFDYEGDIRDIRVGNRIFIDDGNIELVVEGYLAKRLKTRVLVGGLLKDHKGVNVPDAKLHFAGIPEKDRNNIGVCIRHRFDYVAQSFVRTEDDIIRVKRLINKDLPECGIIAKIENREGIANIDGIIDASDGIMIARGDMGVSLPIYEVPMIQKEIIRKCRTAGKFVITATQMLETMTENIRPTRAEVSDVANAILDGSDYLMLSAETSVGNHPIEAVSMMNSIIKFTERYRDGDIQP